MPFAPESTETTRVVTFKWVPASSDAGEDPIGWTFDNPGSYQDADDPMKHTTLPVDEVVVTLDGSPGHWSVRSILIKCIDGDEASWQVRTYTISSAKYELVPWWLVKLVGRAQQ